ncbi:MAG: L-rhamnose isomerase [Armatimonadota bacterium]
MSESFNRLTDELGEKGVDVESVITSLQKQHIETPSWGYGNSGTRFRVFPNAAAARNVHEKIDDAALIHKLSGIAPSVALHIPWDYVSDWKALGEYAIEAGIKIGAINPNVFQDEAYMLGSLCHANAQVRTKAIDHMAECCEIMSATGSDLLSIWLADGTNYAGQDSIRGRRALLLESLKAVYAKLPVGSRMLLEYKFFEPAFYHTDIADWGTSFALCRRLGPQAQVLVDTGHHAPGTNIAYIVAQLLDEGCLGGFHFNSRNYADDDLIVGSTNPFELFTIFTELVSAGNLASDVAYMIDQSHNIEPKLEAMLLSVLNCQTALAKALIVDYQGLSVMQANGDVLGAHRLMMDAFETDVRPLVAEVRSRSGVPVDPIAELRSSGIEQKLASERG